MIIAVLLNKIIPKINKEILSKELIEEYVTSLIDYLELYEFYSGIIFVPKNFSDLASYNFHTLKIRMNINRIIKEANLRYHFTKLSDKKILFINLAILEALYHEVIHIFQNYVLTCTNWGFAELFKKDVHYLNSLDETDEATKIYSNYHDLFVIERDANITSFENILHIVIENLNDEELKQYFLEVLSSSLMYGYDFNGSSTSPLKTIFEELYLEDAPNVENLDLYDKIKYGFQIGKSEYKWFKKNSKGLILSKNNLHE